MEGNKGPRVRLQQSICPDTLGVQDQGSHGNIEFFLGEITAAWKNPGQPCHHLFLILVLLLSSLSGGECNCQIITMYASDSILRLQLGGKWLLNSGFEIPFHMVLGLSITFQRYLCYQWSVISAVTDNNKDLFSWWLSYFPWANSQYRRLDQAWFATLLQLIPYW